MEIVLIRHGQPLWEPDGRAVDDPKLTPLGRAQAESAADALADEHFDALYVSPLRRAAETMAPIAARLRREAQVESWLAELRLPRMQGRTSEEVQAFFAAARARELERWWDGMPGGESFRHFYERVTAGVEGLLLGNHELGIHEDGGHRLWKLPAETAKVLIVAHEGTNAVILSHLLGVDPVPWAWMRFSSHWAGITRLRAAAVASGAVWVVEGFNRVHHLGSLEDD
jgi:probable phosphoglycerate mutase